MRKVRNARGNIHKDAEAAPALYEIKLDTKMRWYERLGMLEGMFEK